MAKKKEIQYAVMENAEDGSEPYFYFYDSIADKALLKWREKCGGK